MGVVWVFANIQGMITFLPDGTIHSINENFALMLFGYTQQELIGKVSDDALTGWLRRLVVICSCQQMIGPAELSL